APAEATEAPAEATEAPAEEIAPADFVPGYVLVKKGSTVYSDPSMHNAVGELAEDAVVWALNRETVDGDGQDVYKLAYALKGEVCEGYLKVNKTAALTAEEIKAQTALESDVALDGIVLVNVVFAAPAEETEAPAPEVTEAPETTEAPVTDAAAEDEAAPAGTIESKIYIENLNMELAGVPQGRVSLGETFTVTPTYYRMVNGKRVEGIGEGNVTTVTWNYDKNLFATDSDVTEIGQPVTFTVIAIQKYSTIICQSDADEGVQQKIELGFHRDLAPEVKTSREYQLFLDDNDADTTALVYMWVEEDTQFKWYPASIHTKVVYDESEIDCKLIRNSDNKLYVHVNEFKTDKPSVTVTVQIRVEDKTTDENFNVEKVLTIYQPTGIKVYWASLGTSSAPEAPNTIYLNDSLQQGKGYYQVYARLMPESIFGTSKCFNYELQGEGGAVLEIE
ncbi:MAG: hypothetical protein Q4C54_08840, partial [Clostridia bacterium]|nr:hypothetical protein [Clostridia bacterium]